ncbi:hypothetical protein PRZ48_014753 [Zasmidium cellare]|uniref:N-acetyltransferase domain-containing protein n=1 Tax=Zasmidium cellare TaxID=395010 RepID=A0ABR0DZM4_ZASCE|nr:hypothetical protein PRZ48_014753 [Zasmidium cellare]
MMGDYGIKTPQQFDKVLVSSRIRPAAFPEPVIVDTDPYYMLHLGNRQGPLIGAISFAQRDPLAPPDIGWCLLDTYHRQGYASEAAIEVLRMLKEDLGVKDIICWPGKNNVASQKTAKRVGSVGEGRAKNVKGEDVLVYVLPGMHFDSDLTLSIYGGS